MLKKSIFRKLLFTTKHCANTPMNLRSAYEIFVRDYDNEDWQTQIDYFFSSYDDAKDDGVFQACPKVNNYANLIYALLTKEDFAPPPFYTSVDGKSYKKSSNSLKTAKTKKKKSKNFILKDEIEEQDQELENKETKKMSLKDKRNFRMNSETDLGKPFDHRENEKNENEELNDQHNKEKIDEESNDEEEATQEDDQETLDTEDTEKEIKRNPKKKKVPVEEQGDEDFNDDENSNEEEIKPKFKKIKKVKNLKAKPKNEKKEISENENNQENKASEEENDSNEKEEEDAEESE